MCDGASDPVNRSLLGWAHECLFFDPLMLEETLLAQRLQNSRSPSFYETDPVLFLDQSDSRTAMPLFDDNRVKNTTSATGPSPSHDDHAPNDPTTPQSYWNEILPHIMEPHQASMEQTMPQAKPVLEIENMPNQLEIILPAGLMSQAGSLSPSQRCYFWWKNIPLHTTVVTGSNKFVPQTLYRPFTKERYLERVSLSPPIIFVTKELETEWGISLEDIHDVKTQHLVDKDVPVLQDCGPSIALRICWPGYPPFRHQISSRNWRKKKGPITKERLAKRLATTTVQFIEKMSNQPMEDGADRNWKVGPQHIKAEDLILVSLHHVSKGSWQPQFRLRHDHVGDM